MQARAAATEARRDEILRAALDCFTRKGVGATTMEDIRRASGASIGSIYHHFDGKEQLAGALYVDSLRRYQEGFLAELRGHEEVEARVKAAVRHHLRWVAENRDRAAFLLGRREPEVRLASQAEVRKLNRRVLRETAKWVRSELPFDVFYSILIGPSQEFCRHWLAGRMQTGIDEAAEILAQAAWDSLKGAVAR